MEVEDGPIAGPGGGAWLSILFYVAPGMVRVLDVEG